MNDQLAVMTTSRLQHFERFQSDLDPATQLQHFLKESQMPEMYGIAGHVISEMRSRIGHSPLDMKTIASTMHMSKRTLQRRLKYQGTSFMEIRDQLRKHYAILFLLVHLRNVDYIYTSLDFSDRASLTNAFKRWTGLCPRTFRKTYRDYI
ncbi:MAG: AraC-like DNA-binding protein [Lentisphaeria bacterium]|jgi:AraC-like DNA-binding protein